MNSRSIKNLHLVAAIFLFTISVSVNADDGLDTQVSIPYEMFTLDNGLTVLVHTDHSTPTVFVGMWYAVGSKDEPEGKTGFAHLFEHLMFQGTENREGEYFSPFSDAGATGINGTTSEDRTNYYATVPSGAIDMALWMESDRMTYLLGAITQDALDEQRGVVQNEKLRSENRPYSGMRDRIRAGLYPVDHPYRHSVIGSMDDLDAASLDDVNEWFGKYYGASNVVLVLAGDISVEAAKEKVAFYFGEAPAGEPLVYAKKWVPELVGNREEVMYDRVGQTRIARVWPLPGLNDKDTSLMYLVNDSLVANKNSPLRKILVDDLKLATSVSGSAYGQVLSGEYILSIDLRAGVTPEQVIPIVDQVIEEYLSVGPDEQILENAKLAVNMYMLGALESNASIGRLLAEGFLYSDNPLFINQELEWLNAATADELTAIANRWLSRGYYQLTVLPFPDLNSSAAQADRSTIPSVTADSEINFPDIETVTLKNGMKLVIASRGSIPIVDVSITIETGSAAAPADAPGLSSFMFALMDKGTKKLDANELAAATDKIAMTGSFRDGLERSSLSYRILSAHLGESLRLSADMLRNPVFPEDELEKFKARLAAYLSNIALNPSGAARSLFERAIYGDENPMGGIWTPELLEQVNRDKLVGFHAQEIAPDRMTVYMIGDIDMDEAKDVVNDAFKKWRASADSALSDIGSAPESGPRVILIHHPEAVQSTILAGHAIDPFDASINTELAIMNAVFGGTFESRINMNLREDKSWSYGMGSSIRPNSSGDQYIAVSGSVQSDKTMESMQEIMREYQEYVTTRPPNDFEVGRITLNMTRSLPGQISTNRDFLASIISSDGFGLPFDYAEQRGERLAAITTEGVAARAKAVIDPGKLTWVVIGDLEQIEEKVRSLNYGDVEVWDGFGNRLR